MKKLLSFVLAATLSISLAAPSFAHDVPTFSKGQITADKDYIDMQYFLNLDDEQLKQEFLDMNVSEQDADWLIQLRNSDSNNMQLYASTGARAFPGNPSIGDTHTDRFKIPASVGTNGVTAIAAYLVGLGVINGVAVIVAPMIYDTICENVGIDGVEVTIEYYYGPDNDGEVRWNYRRVWIDTY